MDDFASSTNGTNGPYAPSLEANSHGGSRPTHSQSGPAHLGVAPESQPSAYDGPDDEYPTAPHLSSKTSGMSEDRTRYPRISLPVELMRDSYDVVVIGTGYGGSVAASRMARGRQSVCVLERGKERWPGEFPEALHTAAGEIRVSGEFAPGDRRGWPGSLIRGGNPTGLYHFAAGDGQNVYMANGLGGTSLVNANVFMEATPAVLDMSIWPEELRGSDAWRQCKQPFCFPISRSMPAFLDGSGYWRRGVGQHVGKLMVLQTMIVPAMCLNQWNIPTLSQTLQR